MLKDITIQPDITIRQAMKALDKTAEKCLLVVDKSKKLLGTLTDGDLRRSILAGVKFTDSIFNNYNNEPTLLIRGEFKPNVAEALLREQKLDLIPIVDNNRVVVDFVTWTGISGGNKPTMLLEHVPVVIMAGGKGTRMEPFTKILPKPLVPIHDKPIIEHIIERFVQVGCSKYYLTINYKGKILKAYFEEL